MAIKMVFLVDNKGVYEDIIDYQYVPGLSKIQKIKNLKSLHESIKLKFPAKNYLEISTKSDNNTGVLLSSFNLEINMLGVKSKVENVYQGSKVFEDSGPHEEVFSMSALESKKYIRDLKRGELKAFQIKGKNFDIMPPTSFYDYIYLIALVQNKKLADNLLKYEIFTDIEFNFKKQINCQARSAAIFVFLSKNKILEKYLSSYENFKSIYTDILFKI
jgi:hypothetical protein